MSARDLFVGLTALRARYAPEYLDAGIDEMWNKCLAEAERLANGSRKLLDTASTVLLEQKEAEIKRLQIHNDALQRLIAAKERQI